MTANFDGSSQKTTTDVEKNFALNPEAVKLSTDTLRLLIDESKEVQAQILPSTTSQLFAWNKQGSVFGFSVVNGNTGSVAKVEGKQKGQGLLLVSTVKDSSKVDTLFVIVDYKAVTSISLSADTLRLKTGGYRDSLQVELKPTGVDPTFHFSTSDTNIATVDSQGHILSVGVGEAWIFAHAGEKRDSTWIQVMANRPPRILGLKDTTVSISDTVHLFFKPIDLDGSIVKVGVDTKRNGKLDDTLPLLSDSTKFYHLRRILNDSGSYLIIAGAMDNDGAIGFDSARVHVIQDIPTVDAGKDTSGKAGQALTLQGSAIQKFGSIVMWKWDFNGDGNWDDSSATSSTLSYTYPTDGTFNAKLYARDDDGNVGTDTRVVSMGNVLPQFASKRGDTTVSIKDSVAFSASLLDQDGVIKQVAWDFDGDGSYDDSTTPNSALANVKASHRYSVAGKYTVAIRGRDNGGGSVKDSLHVTVLMDAPVANAGVDTTVLTGSPFTLHAKGNDLYGSIVKREWQIGTGADFIAVGSVDTTITAPPTPSFINCILRLTDDDGVVGLDTLVVTAIYDTDSRLSALAGSTGNLAPGFATETLAYTLTLANTATSVRILPTLRSSRATVKVNGIALSGTPAGVTIATAAVGNYTATVLVTAEDTSKHTTYVVTITKVASSVSTLSALSATYHTPTDTTTQTGTLSPSFLAATLSYVITVPDSVDTVKVSATRTNAEATIRLNGVTSLTSTWSVKADTGVTQIAIQVTAGDGSVRNYALKVYRKAWIQVGATPFISGSSSYVGLCMYQAKPVVGFRSGTGFATVSQLSANNWVDAGNNPVSPGSALYVKLVSSPNYVFGIYGDYSALTTGNGKVILRRWAGTATTWTSRVISDTTILSVTPAIATFRDSAYVAYTENAPTNHRLQVKKYNASGVLSSLGVSVSDSTVTGDIATTVDSSGKVWVAYGDLYSTRNGRLTVKYWDATSSAWVLSGSIISASTVAYLNFTSHGDTLYLAYQDGGNMSKLTVLRKIGSGSWNNLGGSGFSEGIAYYVSLKVYNNEPYVAYRDAGSANKAVVKVYRAGEWQNIGSAGFSPGISNYLSLDFDSQGRPNLAYSMSSPTAMGVLVRYFDPQAEGL